MKNILKNPFTKYIVLSGAFYVAGSILGHSFDPFTWSDGTRIVVIGFFIYETYEFVSDLKLIQ